MAEIPIPPLFRRFCCDINDGITAEFVIPLLFRHYYCDINSGIMSETAILLLFRHCFFVFFPPLTFSHSGVIPAHYILPLSSKMNNYMSIVQAFGKPWTSKVEWVGMDESISTTFNVLTCASNDSRSRISKLFLSFKLDIMWI